VSEPINVALIKAAVQQCCRTEEECNACTGKGCLIGFAKLVSEYAETKKALSIPNGLKLVPSGDFKVYEGDAVASALAVINHECKNCMDNHDDNCVINIIRSSLEVALLGEHLSFTGNPLAYIMAFSQVNPELGQKIMAAYRDLKNG
jgi:hypothetical protein